MSDTSTKTILITGATDGVGRLAARRLAASGHRVIVHGRSEQKGAQTLQEIQRETPDARVEFQRADLASLDDVRGLANDVTSVCDRLDVLINNAGIGFGGSDAHREASRDGHELRFAVNYLAPVLLTHLLLPLIRRSAPARIVNVASIGQSPVDFDDVMMTRAYDGRRAYTQSKLALVMFTFDLAATLEGAGVTVNAIHPATFMATKMVTEAGFQPMNTVERGADAILNLVSSPELANTSGAFFDGLRQTKANAAAYDLAGRQRLRDLAATCTGVTLP